MSCAKKHSDLHSMPARGGCFPSATKSVYAELPNLLALHWPDLSELMGSMKHDQAACHMNIEHTRCVCRVRVASAAAAHSFKLHSVLTTRYH
eukprot:COSAG02_NODE_23827_length_707_cov_0.827303_1_plen_91_part_10